MLVYSGMDLKPIGCTESDFQTCRDLRKLTKCECVCPMRWSHSMEECKTNLHCRFHYKGKICGNFGNHKRTKHIHGKDHIIREAVVDRIVDVVKIATENNLIP